MIPVTPVQFYNAGAVVLTPSILQAEGWALDRVINPLNAGEKDLPHNFRPLAPDVEPYIIGWSNGAIVKVIPPPNYNAAAIVWVQGATFSKYETEGKVSITLVTLP